MGEVVIRVVANASTGWQPDKPIYVLWYDPNAFGGHGDLQATTRPLQAKRFPDVAEAWEFARQESTVCPLRPDGQPNRPLTAYTLEIMPYVDAVLGKVIL